jgi:soluble lytic murein transglycosylase-like protein
MLSTMGRPRAYRFGRVALALVVAACAASSDTVPAAPGPEQLATAAPAPMRLRQRTGRPFMATRTSVPVPTPAMHPWRPAPSMERPEPVPSRPAVKVRVDSAAMERAITKRFAYQPLSVALAKRSTKTELADRIAAAVVYEAERNRMSPSLLAAVLLIENAPFDTTAISSQGAVGLMQVMPVHIGSYGCPSRDLHSVEANICHGARILKSYIRRAKSVPLGLTRYNGCVRGRNTPRCHRYPGRVLRVASKVRHDMLVGAAELEGESPDDVSMTDPAEPVLSADTTITTAAGPTNECTTLMGCLRQRWTSR